MNARTQLILLIVLGSLVAFSSAGLMFYAAWTHQSVFGILFGTAAAT